MKDFKIGDIVFVSNPDTEYEREWGERYHRDFFGKVTNIETYENEVSVEVEFENGNYWYYHTEELSHANEIKSMTLEDFSNKFGVCVTAVYL